MTSLSRRAGAALLCYIGAVCLTGCTGGAEGQSEFPETVAVTGTVTYNGQPVEGATVTFSPDIPQHELAMGKTGGHAAFATTDAKGVYSLYTAWGSGAVPGDYNVTVTKYDQPPVAAGAASDDEYEPPEFYENQPAAAAAPKSLLPAKYAQAGELKVTVSSSGGTHNLELKD